MCLVLEDFYKNAKENEYLSFAHTAFFYSYPQFGKSWKKNQDSQFHRVNLYCSICRATDVKNVYGYRTMFLIKTNNKIKIFCHKHLNNAINFRRKKNIQLKIF